MQASRNYAHSYSLCNLMVDITFPRSEFDCKNSHLWTTVGCAFTSDIGHAKSNGNSCILSNRSQNPISQNSHRFQGRKYCFCYVYYGLYNSYIPVRKSESCISRVRFFHCIDFPKVVLAAFLCRLMHIINKENIEQRRCEVLAFLMNKYARRILWEQSKRFWLIWTECSFALCEMC